MAAITNRLPTPLSERISTATANIYARQGREVDVAIGGVPFRLATASDLPYTIETIPIRKDQVDTEPDPGEQSLAGWWRRSQASFHEGAGLLYQEAENNTPSFGFADSRGIDVFSKRGQLTLIKRMNSVGGAGGHTRLRAYSAGSRISVITGTAFATGTYNGSASTVHNPAVTLYDAIVGDTQFVDIADGTLYSGTVASPGTATTWPLTGNGARRMEWGKHRLWIIGGRRIWQPDLSLTGGTAQAPIFTHPNPDWTYTCLAEAGAAMLFGGHNNQRSSIQAVTLGQTGATPTLSGAAETAIFPDGELVQEIAVLAGQYVGIGTNKGFRVGRVGDAGRIIYGPLLFTPADVTACTAITTQGQFFVVAFNSTEGPITYRVDTSTEITDLVFPYATDVVHPSGAYVQSLAVVTSGLMSLADTGNRASQHLTEYVSTGYLTTGRIRYRTNESKSFRSVKLETEPMVGTIAVDIIQEGGTALRVGTLVEGGTPGARMAIQLSPMTYASVKLTLLPTANSLGTPTIHSYQLTALPAVKPLRLITIPLLCFDKEKAKSGQWYGGSGFAKDRLLALQTVEDQADVVTFQDFTLTGGGLLVTIERLRFVQTTTTSPSSGTVTGLGGILIVELRTAEE